MKHRMSKEKQEKAEKAIEKMLESEKPTDIGWMNSTLSAISSIDSISAYPNGRTICCECKNKRSKIILYPKMKLLNLIYSPWVSFELFNKEK